MKKAIVLFLVSLLTISSYVVAQNGNQATTQDKEIKAKKKKKKKDAKKTIDFDKASYDFGKVKVGKESKQAKFAITNSGGADLIIESLVGSNDAEFPTTQPKKTTLAPGGSSTFKVTFKPAGNGIRGTKITIKNNDADEQKFQFIIIGTGVGADGAGAGEFNPNAGPEIDVLVKE